jgi:serine/threonine-protein kinase HipA
MARRRRYGILNVYLNARLVGQLRRETSGAIEFQYDRDWLAWSYTLPVSLSLPLREDAYRGAPVSAVFENLLPDNNAIRNRIAARARAEGIDAYSLLGAIGHDCVGAMQFLRPDIDPGSAGTVNGTRINSQEVADILSNLATTPLGVSEDENFRISIAGAQEKTALLYWQRHWYIPHGTTATTHIFKPSIGRLPNGVDLTHSVENEYLCLKLVKSFGLPAAEARMAHFGERSVLVVERFDRFWTEDQRLLRIPQEDCCQALSVPPTLKYESDGGPGIELILRLLRDGDTPSEDQHTFMKAMIVFWLLGATDGHAKNFSVFLLPGGRYKMTPLYDVISAQPSVDAGEIRQNRFRLAMAVGDSRHYGINRIVPRHFTQTANRAGIGEQIVPAIFDELCETATNVVSNTFAGLPSGFPEQVMAALQTGIERRLMALRAR